MNTGSGLTLTIGKPKVQTVKTFTHTNVLKLRNKLNCSDKMMVDVMAANRTVYGRKSVQPHVKSVLTEYNSHLHEYFSVSQVSIEDYSIDPKTKKKTIFYDEKPLVVCNSIDEFIRETLEMRDSNLHDSTLLLGFDGGQKFMKLCLNIVENFSPDVKVKRCKYEDGVAAKTNKPSSVKKTLILAIMPDVKELYYNVSQILENFKTEFLHFPSHTLWITADLKIANLTCGIQNHRCTHSCCYCIDTAPWLDTEAPMRTIGGLKHDYRSYVKAGSNRKNAMNFNNVVNQPLFDGDDEVEILDIFCPPELHLYTGSVNYLVEYLIKLTPHDYILDILKQNVRKGYMGSSFEGNQCSEIMGMIDQLQSTIQRNLGAACALACAPVFHTLRKLKLVIAAAFSKSLDPDYKNIISEFEKAYRELCIPVTPKVHIIFTHVVQWCERYQTGLGRYSEQASESLHSDFIHFWENYSTGIDHPDFGERLKSAVIAYNGRHM